MRNTSRRVINITKFEHLCIVVRDLDKSMQSLWNTFGIGPWNIFIRDSDSMSNMSYRGKPAQFTFKVARTRNKVGGLEIELIEPVEGNSIYCDFLREHGEGIHHLGWYRVDSQKALAEITRTLENAGFHCVMSGRIHHSAAFAYFDTTSLLHTILEVVWSDPSLSQRPSRVFPE